MKDMLKNEFGYKTDSSSLSVVEAQDILKEFGLPIKDLALVSFSSIYLSRYIFTRIYADFHVYWVARETVPSIYVYEQFHALRSLHLSNVATAALF